MIVQPLNWSGLRGTWTVLLILLSGCVPAQQEDDDIDDDVQGFISLLVNTADPTLAQFDYYVGTPSEAELEYEIQQCALRAWQPNDRACIDFTNSRWASPENHISYYLSWLRAEFDTVQKDFRVVGTERRKNGVTYDLIAVIIGDHEFVLIHNSDPAFTGLRVDVSEVDGKGLASYRQ